jgi:hypothetical protein
MKEDINKPACGPVKGKSSTGRAVLVFYALLLMLNAGALEESASRLPYGTARDFWLAVLRPCAEAADRLHLGLPRRMAENHFGNHLNSDGGR